jgi:hypothetical protein
MCCAEKTLCGQLRILLMKGLLGRGLPGPGGLKTDQRLKEDDNDDLSDESSDSGDRKRNDSEDQSDIVRCQMLLRVKDDQIEEMKQQLAEKDERISFLQALLHRSHLSESMSDLSKGLTHRMKDLDSYVVNAVAYSEALEGKVASLNKKNRALKQKLSEQTSREEEILILRQILALEEQIDTNQEDEIEYLQSLARRQYEYAARQRNPATELGSREEESESKGTGDQRSFLRKKGRSSSHSHILDEVRNVLDNFGV